MRTKGCGFALAVHEDFYLYGCWQASARQAEGFMSGSCEQVPHREAAVHRLVLWAGALSMAGAISDLLKYTSGGPISVNNYPQIPPTSQ
jgi:hypothetical protein